MENELKAVYSTRKSFNRRPVVRIERFENIEHVELLSYNTLVANYVYYKDANEKVYEYFGRYSRATSSHQKGFFKRLGLDDKDIKTLMKDGTYRALRVRA